MKNLGFDGKKFLTDDEWKCYLRRLHVRYIKKKKDAICCICGLPASAGKPLENAHKIPFAVGIRKYKLTPDYLDGDDNIVTAHRGMCNKKCELSHKEILDLINKNPDQ